MPRANALRRSGGAAPPPFDLLQPARVVNTPATADDEVYVTLTASTYSDDQPIGPVHGWERWPDTAWPQAGDNCIVALVPNGPTCLLAGSWPA